MKKIQSIIAIVLTLSLVALASFSSGACKGGAPQIIQKVVFQPSENLETLRLSLQFAPSIQTNLQGAFTLKDYGYLFINPYTETAPFEIGFEMNTSVFNEQEYVHIGGTTVLPNGMPIGIPYALAEIRGTHPISDKFDLIGYVDVLHTSWIGIATMFSFIDPKYFPPGLSITQQFLYNNQGAPGAIAAVFGPVVNEAGEILKMGGIAFFANVRQLVAMYPPKDTSQRGELALYPSNELIIQGPQAAKYENNPKALLRIQNNLIRGLNQQR